MISFDDAIKIGRIVREQVQVGRVITFGGLLTDSQRILDAAESKEGRFIGINAPRSGAYDNGFRVVHMGYGVDEKVQVPQKLYEAGVPTVLVGKVADIVNNPYGVSWQNLVDSQRIMDITLNEFNTHPTAFICTNIQETDLAGHAEDVARYAERLQVVDRNLARLVEAMQPDDCPVVMADHGNDPTIGHSHHTREVVPVLVYQQGMIATQLGVRTTLSDVGLPCVNFPRATATKWSLFSFLPPVCRRHPMSFDPTGYTSPMSICILISPALKTTWTAALISMRSFAEMNDLMTRGVRNVIEMTNRYMGRNAQFMLDVMRETGINVVACTGYYRDAFFPEHVATRSVQELAQEMVDEIEQGIDGTELKAGIIAEIGTSEGKITPLEEKVFIAAALAHNQTGRPISTHTSFSTMGLEQLALLQAHGVDLSRVTVGHCDLKDNLDNILKMIDLGAYVQFDTIGKNSYYPDEKRIAMLHALRDRGLLNRVMLSMDITRRSHLKANGGYGYDYLLTTFIPQLRQSGFSQADVDVMLRENPSQFFQ